MKIGTLLLKLRKACRLSQSEVADQVGVSQSAYCAWESDRATPGARYYGALAALFKVDIQELLPVDQLANYRLEATSSLPAAGQSATLEEVLIQAQQETIGLQKQRIENLEAENQRLRRSPKVG